MAQAINQISLYKKMDKELSEKVNLEIEIPRIYYIENNENKEIEIEANFNNVLAINSVDSMWSPNENDLNIKQLFKFNQPDILYGKNGITMDDNKIGLAVHIHSRNSNFQQTLDISSIPNTGSSFEVEFNHKFNMGTLRGNIIIDFFLYLKELVQYDIQHANKIGMVLSEGNIHSLELITDGDGSAFPMSEFEDKDGPLWKLEKNWIEPNIDMFDISNVNLSLNTSHKLFEQVKAGKTRAARAIMGDIMINAISMIIQEVILIEKYTIDDKDDVLPGSILQAVQYWVNTFEVETKSLFTISNSLRRYWDKQMLEGEKSDD